MALGAFRVHRGRPYVPAGHIAPGLTPWRSWAPVSQATINTWSRGGNPGDPFYNTRAMGGFLTPLYQTITDGQTLDIYITFKKPTTLAAVAGGGDWRGMSHVDIQVNEGPIYTLTGTTRTPHPDSSEQVFHATVYADDFPSGIYEMRATGWPTVGKPMVVQGRKCAGPANATSLTSLTDTAAGPRGYSIDPRTIPFDNGENIGARVTTQPDMWSLVFAVSRTNAPLPTMARFIDTVAGNDANDGLTVATPVLTMDPIMAAAATMNGGDYGGLDVYYCGAHLNHTLPSWSASHGDDWVPRNCDARPVRFFMAPGFTKSTLQISQNAAHPVQLEKQQWSGFFFLNCTLQATNTSFSGGPWSQHMDTVWIDCDHVVTTPRTGSDGLGAMIITNGGTGYTHAAVGVPARGTGADMVTSARSLNVSGGAVIGESATFTILTPSLSGTTYTVTPSQVNGMRNGAGSTSGSGYFDGDAFPITGDGTGATAVVRLFPSPQDHVTPLWGGSPYSGHNQFIRCTFNGSDFQGVNWPASLVVACTVTNALSNDIFDICKLMSGCHLTYTISAEAWSGNHMDLYQWYGQRTGASLFGLYVDSTCSTQGFLADSGATLTDTMMDCCGWIGTTSNQLANGPQSSGFWDTTITGGQLTFPLTNPGYIYPTFSDSQFTLTNESTSVMNGLWTPPRTPGQAEILEYNWFQGKRTLYYSDLYQPVDQASTGGDFAFASPYSVFDTKLGGYIKIVTQGSGSTTQTGGGPVTSPAFSPTNAPRISNWFDAINANYGAPNNSPATVAGLWMYDGTTYPVGVANDAGGPGSAPNGSWDRRRPILRTAAINGLDAAEFNGLSRITTWPNTESSFLGSQIMPAGVVGANEFELWMVLKILTQDTTNPTYPKIVRGLANGSLSLTAVMSGTNVAFQANITHSAGSQTLTDAGGKVYAPNSIVWIRWGNYLNTSQITIGDVGTPGGYAYNSGTPITYSGSGSKNQPGSVNTTNGVGGSDFNPYGLYNNPSFGAHFAMQLQAMVMTPTLSGSNLTQMVTAVRARCGF